ncbi:protein RRP5 homolog [Spea bombifrons]|uniref:protein RRP5 homolog n=1 Tax=Spea bombifrons TaxID=233779 RepID=UPI002349EE6A|nr:protein RRP5 homolog [Spea bombifrons]
MEEECFPRGGSLPKSDQSTTKKRKKESDNLFSFHEEEEETRKKKRKAVSEKPKAVRPEKVTPTKEQPVKILRFKDLSVGFLLLGCVKEAKDFELVVSLPYGLTGYVHAMNICEAYTKLLSEQVEKEVMLENLTPLSDLYSPGMLIRCAVSGLETTAGGFNSVKLAVDPKLVNSVLVAASLQPGMLLSGCVSSVEDHGYLVDIGVGGSKAFLPRQKAQVFLKQANKGAALRVGEYLNCVVDEVKNEGRIVRLSIVQSEVAAAFATVEQKWTLNNLLPGLVVKAKITKVSSSKISLSFLSSYTGAVDFLHFDLLKKSAYSVDQEVKACILWVDPSSKNFRLTLRQSFVQPGSSVRQLSSSLVGSVIEDCAMKSMFKTAGAFFQLGEGTLGFAFMHNLSEKPKGVEKIKDGTRHTVRVIEYSPMDETLLISLKTSVVEGLFLRHEDIRAGQIVEGTVSTIEPVGMVVKITNYLSGLVPRLHLADVELQHPELKYKTGLSVKCRVLTADPTAKKLILTRKKTLLNSRLPVIASFEDAKPGLITHGFIVSIKTYGCIVKFYNEVQALALRSQLSSEPIHNPEEVFYKGQVIKVRVVECNVETQRILVSFKLTEEDDDEEPTLKKPNPKALEIGKVVDVKVVAKTDEGLDVVTLPENTPAFLPKMHLSDYITNCNLLWRHLEVGDILPGAMYLSSFKKKNILTRKSTLIAAVKEDDCVKEFSDLQIGMLLPGFVRNTMPYGVFVQLSHGLVGLAPKSEVADKFVTDVNEHFVEGQTVVAKVLETDEERKRCLLTLKLSQCAPDDCSDDSFSRLSQCFSEQQLLKSMISRKDDDGESITSLVPGKKLNLVVEEVEEDGTILFAVAQIPGAEKVMASNHNLGGKSIDSGQKVKAVVLYVDLIKSHVYVSLNNTLLKKKGALTENSTYFAVVQHVAEEFAVVALEGTSHLAAVPVSCHFNDTHRFESEKLSIGKRISITLKTASAEEHGYLLAVRDSTEKKHKKRDKKTPESAAPGSCIQKDLQIGSVVSATVKTVKPNSVVVSIDDKAVGFIHVSQILEEMSEGSFPTSKLKPKQSLTCRIIGARDVKSHRFLPITHPNFKQSLPELSLLPSVIEKEGDLPPPKNLNMYSVGEKVTCFVLKYYKEMSVLEVELTPGVRGRIEQLLLSHTPKVLKRPEKNFKQGQALSATVVSLDASLKYLHLSLTGFHRLEKGTDLVGRVKKVIPGSCLVISLPFRKTGKVDLFQLSDCHAEAPLDSFSPGQFVRCCVLSTSATTELSLRKSRLNPESNISVANPEITSVESLEEGQCVSGYVSAISEKGVFFRLSSTLVGHLKFSNVTSYYVPDIELYKKYIPEGTLLTAKVIGKDTEEKHVDLSFLPEDTGKPDVIPESTGLKKRIVRDPQEQSDKRKRKVSQSETKDVPEKKKKKKKSQENKEDEDSGVEVYCREDKGENKDKTTDTKDRSKQSISRLEVPAGFSWDVSLQTLRTSLADVKESSSDSEDEEEPQPKTKKTAKEKAMEKKEAEKELSKIEAALMDPNRQPQSADDFDRLVVSSPNSSILWLQYMAFHLQATEIEKARAVAERALKTISFREEQEKLNVWVALLNLENMYGTEESLLKAFERAVQYNEPLKVFQQLADIYIKSEKFKQAEDLFNTMLKRFRQEKSVWLKYATFLLRQGQKEATHKLLQRALKCLPEKEHIDVISKFAQLEFNLGDTERAKALFESTLSNYPKRTDLWSVYIDMMMKHGGQKEVRDIFERVIHLSMTAKRIKFFFKRYLEYEKKHGTAESIQAVKEKALAYVESKSSVTTS